MEFNEYFHGYNSLAESLQVFFYPFSFTDTLKKKAGKLVTSYKLFYSTVKTRICPQISPVLCMAGFWNIVNRHFITEETDVNCKWLF